MASFSAHTFKAIVPSDSVNFAEGICEGIYVAVSGNIVAVGQDGAAVTFTAVAAGGILPIRALRVNSTGTTATGLVACYFKFPN
jgi:hypothetical protein